MASNSSLSFRCGGLYECLERSSRHSRQDLLILLGYYRCCSLRNLCVCLRIRGWCPTVCSLLPTDAVCRHVYLVARIRQSTNDTSEISELAWMGGGHYTECRSSRCIFLRDSGILQAIDIAILLRNHARASYPRRVHKCSERHRTVSPDLLLLGTVYRLAVGEYHRHHYVQWWVQTKPTRSSPKDSFSTLHRSSTNENGHQCLGGLDYAIDQFSGGSNHLVPSMEKRATTNGEKLNRHSIGIYLLCFVILNFCITARLKPIRLVNGRGLLLSE